MGEGGELVSWVDLASWDSAGEETMKGCGANVAVGRERWDRASVVVCEWGGTRGLVFVEFCS